jgi:hypothetical protein
MNEWRNYSARLLWAMQRAGKTNQSELARVIGVKPQSIQYLCDPDSGAQGSTHTPALARELGVLADWLARGEGQPTDIEHVKVLSESANMGYAVVPSGRAEVVGTYRLSGAGDVERMDLPPGESDGHVQTPLQLGKAQAVRVKGNALSPYVKDGQFLLLQLAGDDAQPEDNVVLTLKDGRVLIRELMVKRDDGLVLLPVQGGQPETVDRQDIARLDVIVCVVPRRWWRASVTAMHQRGP